MKKISLLLGIVLTLLSEISPSVAEGRVINVKEQDTREVLQRDFLITMLSPYIQKAIDNHYQGTSRQYGLYQTQIRDIKRLCDKGQFYFQATVVVETWTGPKNPLYGLETITLTNEPNSVQPYVPAIRILKFTHQEEVEPILPNRNNCPPHH